MQTTRESLRQDQVYLRAAQLRARWGGMANSTLYWRLKKGLIPLPEYPFGPTTPYWRLATIEEWEREAASRAAS
jgi:predicted DNA-binding transcriptional regulator AlpA